MPEQGNAAQDTIDPVPDAAPQLASAYIYTIYIFCTSINLQGVPLVVSGLLGQLLGAARYSNYAQMQYNLLDKILLLDQLKPVITTTTFLQV